ncbi:hypothetical protein EBT16_08000 [bacterium]|nr:hypothetical protein [bacterium]
MPSNLTSKPSYLSKYETETSKVEDVDFGWDVNGMWFTGNANAGSEEGPGEGGYPVRTNFDFEESDVCEVIYTIDYNDGCADHGICIFNVGTEPEWDWNPNETRIAASNNCESPYIYGRSSQVNGEASEGGEFDGELGLYTFHFTYDPGMGTVNLKVYAGESTGGDPMADLTINETLPAGPYRIGFTADQDDFGIRSYFKTLNIKKNGVSVTSSSYTYDFSPDNPETMPNYKYGGEGNLDTAVVVEGETRRSVQRTGYFEIVNADGGRKVVEVYDGETVDDTVEVPNVPANPTGNPNVSDSGSTL